MYYWKASTCFLEKCRLFLEQTRWYKYFSNSAELPLKPLWNYNKSQFLVLRGQQFLFKFQKLFFFVVVWGWESGLQSVTHGWSIEEIPCIKLFEICMKVLVDCVRWSGCLSSVVFTRLIMESGTWGVLAMKSKGLSTTGISRERGGKEETQYVKKVVIIQ